MEPKVNVCAGSHLYDEDACEASTEAGTSGMPNLPCRRSRGHFMGGEHRRGRLVAFPRRAMMGLLWLMGVLPSVYCYRAINTNGTAPAHFQPYEEVRALQELKSRGIRAAHQCHTQAAVSSMMPNTDVDEERIWISAGLIGLYRALLVSMVTRSSTSGSVSMRERQRRKISLAYSRACIQGVRACDHDLCGAF